MLSQLAIVYEDDMQHRGLNRCLLIIWIASMALAACGQPGQTTSTPILQQSPLPPPISEQTEISFACFASLLDSCEQLAKEFQLTNPDMTVQVVTVEEVEGAEATSLREALSRVASQTDAFAYVLHEPAIEQGLVRDLTPFLEADPTFDPDDFYPGTLELYRWHGGLWALPGSLNFQLIHYDKERFDAAGVPYPRVGWTYEQFVDTARQITLRQGEEVVQYGFVDPWDNGLLPFIHGRAGPLLDKTSWPPQPVLDRPELVEAVQWYADLALKHEAMPNAAQLDERLIADLRWGQAAMWVDTPTRFEQEGQREREGMITFPEGSHPANALTTWGYFMSVSTAHPQEVWRWLAFLTRQEVAGTGIPPRQSVADANGFWSDLEAERAEVYRHALQNAFTSPGIEVEMTLREATRTVLAGDKTAKEALAEAQAALLGQPPETDVVSTPAAKATPVPAGDVTTIRFVPPLLATAHYEKLADAFEEAHPTLRLDIWDRLLSDDSLETLAKRGDCFAWWDLFPIPTEHESILSLQPLLEADTGFPLADFYPQILDTGRWKGGLWALPYAFSLPVIRYNKDLFDAAGVAYPQPGWTWDDFLEKAVALSDGEGMSKQYGFAVLQIYHIRQFVRQQAGPLLDVTTEPPWPRLDDPAVVGATRRLADLVRLYHVMQPIAIPQNPKDVFDELLRRQAMRDSGKVAMWIEQSTALYMDDETQFQKGTASLPQGEGSVEVSGCFLYISADSAHPEVCWEWFKFLTARQYPRGGAIPARRSLAESDTFRERVGDEAAEALLFSVKRSDNIGLQVDSAYPQLGRIVYWFERAYVNVVDGMDAEQALGDAQRKAEAYVVCLKEREGFGDRRVALACAREADPEYRGWRGDE